MLERATEIEESKMKDYAIFIGAAALIAIAFFAGIAAGFDMAIESIPAIQL